MHSYKKTNRLFKKHCLLTQAKTISWPLITIRSAASSPIPELLPVIKIRFFAESSYTGAAFACRTTTAAEEDRRSDDSAMLEVARSMAVRWLIAPAGAGEDGSSLLFSSFEDDDDANTAVLTDVLADDDGTTKARVGLLREHSTRVKMAASTASCWATMVIIYLDKNSNKCIIYYILHYFGPASWTRICFADATMTMCTVFRCTWKLQLLASMTTILHHTCPGLFEECIQKIVYTTGSNALILFISYLSKSYSNSR